MDAKRFARLMGALGQAFNRTVEPATLMAYEMALADMPIERLEAAALKAMQTETYFPVPAVLRRLAGHSQESEAARAWELVITAIRESGIHKRVTFGPRINACIRQLGGWVRLNDLGGDDLHVWAHKEFTKLYEQNANEGHDTPLDAGELYSHDVVRYALPSAGSPQLQEAPQSTMAIERARMAHNQRSGVDIAPPEEAEKMTTGEAI